MGWRTGVDIDIEDTIVATFAGLIAQKLFHPGCSTMGASEDQDITEMLLKEMYPDDFIGYKTDSKRSELQKTSQELAGSNWPAIVAIARNLWNKPPMPRELEPECGWSHVPEEKPDLWCRNSLHTRRLRDGGSIAQ